MAQIGSASIALNEVLREALSAPVDGEPALVVRIVPKDMHNQVLKTMRADVARQQYPVVSVCIGIFLLEEYRLGAKHTVNVGSDDCEQRSWTHFASFKALRSPRVATDIPVCIGEAQGTWTARVARQENCTGEAMGIQWLHKATFYIGEDAMGAEMCVRRKQEEDEDLLSWSRWQIVPKTKGRCGRNDGYTTEFVFRSMEDTYLPPRTYVCVDADNEGRLHAKFECDPLATKSSAYAVLQAQYAIEGDSVYCIGRSSDVSQGDRIQMKANCTSFESGVRWEHVASFALPESTTGRAWCIGRGQATNPVTEEVREHFIVASQIRCDDAQHKHLYGFREVALEEMSEDIGLLSLSSV